MTVRLDEFFESLVGNPLLILIVLLMLAVILVNGWTDAPNAIATMVSTRSMAVGRSIFLATVFNFLGVFVMTMVNAKVAMTMATMVDFRGNSGQALVALSAGMVAIVLWATGAWYFGIPTSESHALIAGVSGSAIALQGGISGINGSEWMKVIYGLFFSTILGFVLGYLFTKILQFVFVDVVRQRSESFFLSGVRLWLRQRWLLCMARRMDRSLWVFLCWGFFLVKVGEMFLIFRFLFG